MKRFLVLSLAIGLLGSACAMVAPSPAMAGQALADCADDGLLARVMRKENEAARRFGEALSPIVTIERISERFHVQSRVPGTRERRGCQARAILQDGHHRSLYYLIEAAGGFVGLGARVESCLEGHDRWHVHSGDCRTLTRW